MNDRRDRDTERELRFHVEQHAADLMAKGVPREEAFRQARIEFGGVPQVHEECRDARPGRWLEQLGGHLRYASRGMRQHPAATLAVILTVAICIAVNTAVFTVVDSLLLRPLPFRDAGRLVIMMNEYPRSGVTDTGGSAMGDYFDRQGKITALSEHALTSFEEHPVERGGMPTQVRGLAVTASFFPLLGVRPAQGRLFTEGESEPGKNFSVILTEEFRRELFGSDNAIGKQVRLSGQPCAVVGVLPAGFRYQSPEIRYFLPLRITPEDRQSRHSNRYQYIARLRDGATLGQAQSQIDSLNQGLVQESRLKDLLMSAGFHTRVHEFQPWLVRQARPSLQLLWAGAGVVLLIGMVNLAGLAIARASSRARETGTRLALGASRGQLVIQQLTECSLPAWIGGALGIAGGWAALRGFDQAMLPRVADVGLAPGVVIYAMAGAAVAGVLAGLASLLPTRQLDLARALTDGGRGGSARRNTGLRRVLVGAQVGLAFVLLYSAGVLTASLRELARVNPGFATERVWTARSYLPEATYHDPAASAQAGARVVAGLRSMPGVESAAVGSALPFQASYSDRVVIPEGYTPKPGESVVSPARLIIGPGYFESLGIRPVHGRVFEDRDGAAPRIIIVDEKLAKRFWPGQNPVGRRMRYAGEANSKTWFTVVGVVPSVRLQDLAGSGHPVGVFYVPWTQAGSSNLSMIWRAKPGADNEVLEAVRREFSGWVPGAALFEVRSLADRREQTLVARRAAQSLALIFAIVAALLAAIGIYGLFAFLLTQRRREIGIRMAMGCRPAGVVDLFLRDGLALSTAGLMGGFALVLGVKQWIAAQLYGVGALDPSVLALVAAALALVAATAIAGPAWRASRVDPAIVLRDS